MVTLERGGPMTRNGHEGQDVCMLANVFVLCLSTGYTGVSLHETLHAEIYLHTFLIVYYTSIKSFKNWVLKKLKWNTWSLITHMELLFKSLRKNSFSQIIFLSKRNSSTHLEKHSLKLAQTVTLSHSKMTFKQTSSLFHGTIPLHRTLLPSTARCTNSVPIWQLPKGDTADLTLKGAESCHVATLRPLRVSGEEVLASKG